MTTDVLLQGERRRARYLCLAIELVRYSPNRYHHGCDGDFDSHNIQWIDPVFYSYRRPVFWDSLAQLLENLEDEN
jgi:hypothetical protein